MQTLYVLNPNSLDIVTQAIADALACLGERCGVAIECLTSKEGPPGIVTQFDADRAIVPLIALAQQVQAHASAFVVACFSDPGLHALRERVRQPVLGIGECAMLTACTRGQRIGVIAVSSDSIARHLRYYGAMGLAGRVARERAIDLGVAESAHPALALQRMVDVGKRLRDEDAADVIVMGCAGMASMRAAIEQALGLPVVEPCQAAAAMAIGRLLTA